MFDEVGIWYAPVNDYEDVEEDPQVGAQPGDNDLRAPAGWEGGVLSHPVRYDSEVPPLRSVPSRAGRTHGGDTDRVGYGTEEIDELKAKGVAYRGTVEVGQEDVGAAPYRPRSATRLRFQDRRRVRRTCSPASQATSALTM